MSSAEQQRAGAAATTTSVDSLLDQAINMTRQTEPDRAKELIATLTEQALAGVMTWDKNVTKSINRAIAEIDRKMSKQLNAIMHHADFKKLEGSWRGLHYLVMNSETSTSLKIKVLNVSKKDLFKDLDRAVEFDQSQFFKKLYESEFGTPGGEPYGAVIGDYEFENHPEDIDMLMKISNVAAAAHCPFLTASSPRMFGFDSWNDLSKPRDLAKIFDTIEYTKWQSFRKSEDSRYVVLTMPRTLARLPYGAATRTIEEFGYEEADSDEIGRHMPMQHHQYTWMNAAYVMGTRMTHAFATTGFCTAIRGAEGGGKVENLPCHIFVSDDGDPDMQCPTEIGITDRREFELSNLGFLPLCHYKNTDYAVFFGGQTAQKPKKYDRPEATENAEISARLPYIMAASRFAHFLKVIARDKIGSFQEKTDVHAFLQRWISNYVLDNPNAGQDAKAKFPLREAKVMVQEIPGKPGAYNAICWLRPWLQLEELNASVRMVAKIPQMGQ